MKRINLLKFYIFIKPFKYFFTVTSNFVSKRIAPHKGHFLSGILIGFIISLVVTILAMLGHFKPYENPMTDLLQSITHKKAEDVVLLFITEEEYKNGFNSKSPLSRERLATIIEILVKLKAKVIALDIDISDPTDEDEILSRILDSAKGVPIVVVGNLMRINERTSSGTDPSNHLRPYPEETAYKLKKGLVPYKSMTPGEKWIGKVIYGGVTFRLDSDGIFRHAEAIYINNDSDTIIPSFPVAVTAAYLSMTQQKDLVETLSHFNDQKITLSGKRNDSQHKICIHLGRGGRITPNFIGNYEHFNREINLSRLIEDYKDYDSKNIYKTIFTNKVVIVGGVYDPKDFYLTPVGRMSGMEVLANITQNIISEEVITHFNFLTAFVIEVLLGTIVALIFILTSRFRANMICFAILGPVAVIASCIAFSNTYHWFDFIPTFVGVMLHDWVKKMEEDLKKLKSNIKSFLEKRSKKTKR